VKVEEVDVAPLREAFERSGMTASEVAIRLGWFRANGDPDGTKVRKKLGIVASYSHGRHYHQRTMSYENGVAFVRALEIAPVDVGV
jgi:hypothetical protein